MFLVFYRQLDKPDGRHEGPINTSIGVEWGIFVAFLLGALLAYAGFRIRQSHVPEPVADDAPPPTRGGPGEPPPEPAPWLDEDDDAPTRAATAHEHDRRPTGRARAARRGEGTARRRRPRGRRAGRVPPAAAQALSRPAPRNAASLRARLR